MTTITFAITYHASWTERLCVVGSAVELGEWDDQRALTLTTTDGVRWSLEVTLPDYDTDVRYGYLVKDAHGVVLRREWRSLHYLPLMGATSTMYMADNWIDSPAHPPHFSSAYYDVLCPHLREELTPPLLDEGKQRIILHAVAPIVPPTQRVYISGVGPSLGNWQVSEALPMRSIGEGQWCATVTIDKQTYDQGALAFKLLIADEARQSEQWETGENRMLLLPESAGNQTIVANALLIRMDGSMPRFAGSVAPLFAMRSASDWGIGDFSCLQQAVDWSAMAGLHVLQILPINDTTFYRDYRDSYPYNIVSVDAIHPIYIGIDALVPLRDSAVQQDYLRRAEVLRLQPSVSYPEVIHLKEQYLRLHHADYGAETRETADYLSFVSEAEHWLMPYAVYCCLRDRHPELTPEDWGAYSSYQGHAVRAFMDDACHAEEIGYHFYVQYLLHRQLSALSSYASERGVLLKGDIPIGVAPHSLEVWRNPQWFHQDRCAGAPPDVFAVDGQNWGFPTYNWLEMQRSGYSWWRGRLGRMSAYFKAFRIDHVLGFFRIWEIPRDQFSGLLGHFNLAEPEPLAYWQGIFPEFVAAELLTLPCISCHEAEEQLTPEGVSRLLEEGYLKVLAGIDGYYVLEHGRQYRWSTLDPQTIYGGAKTIRQMINWSREVALVEDQSLRGYYHPRIAFETSRLYASWPRIVQERWQAISHNYYYHRHNHLWKDTALERLSPLISSTDMLVCAEDLGMLPPSVGEVLERLGMLSLDLERMPKTFSATGWYDLTDLPYHAVATTSTHDMPPLRLWWQCLGVKKQGQYLASQQPERRQTTSTEASELFLSIVARHLESRAMLTVLPVQDWMAISPSLHIQSPEEEQINHPENPNQHWTYRLPITWQQAMTNYESWTLGIKIMLQVLNRY